jgi:hypothetical protein
MEDLPVALYFDNRGYSFGSKIRGEEIWKRKRKRSNSVEPKGM